MHVYNLVIYICMYASMYTCTCMYAHTICLNVYYAYAHINRILRFESN